MKTLWEILDDKSNRTAFVAAIVATHGVNVATGDKFAAHHAERIAANLVSLANQIRTLAEQDCSYGLTAGQEKRDERLKAKFTDIAERCGFVATVGGDPRGACAYIAKTGERGDDMGERGWAVYS